MSEQAANGAGGRLMTCRACGNRVARSARHCPACGAREPTGAGAPAPPPARVPFRRRHWRTLAALGVAALAGAAVSAAVFTLRPVGPPPIERPPEPRAVPPSAPTAPAAPAAPEPSRSRGRTDWLFFFKAGDHLVRMGGETPIGMVIRTVPSHTFPDGTMGPAYLVQVPDGGGQRFVDADELERGGRLR